MIKDLYCPFFALVVVVVTELATDGVLSELLYSDDVVLMSEIIVKLRNKFIKWKKGFESKSLKVNFEKTNVMVSVGINMIATRLR